MRTVTFTVACVSAVACALLVAGCGVEIPTSVRVRMSASPLPLEKPPHAKTLPLAEVQRRACFPVLVISDAAKRGYSLRRSQIVWMPRGMMHPDIPSRQAVCLMYAKRGSSRQVRIIQVPNTPGVDRRDNLRSVAAAGCFGTKGIATPGLSSDVRTLAGVDYTFLSEDASDAELSAFASGVAPAPSAVPIRKPLRGWQPKDLSPDELKRRIRFTVLWPTWVPPGYSLDKCQAVWVVRDPSRPHWPARQAVRLIYRKAKAVFCIIQVRQIAGAKPGDNIGEILALEYFDLLDEKDYYRIERTGDSLTVTGPASMYTTHAGVDVCIVSPPPGLADEMQIDDSLRAGAAPVTPAAGL